MTEPLITRLQTLMAQQQPQLDKPQPAPEAKAAPSETPKPTADTPDAPKPAPTDNPTARPDIYLLDIASTPNGSPRARLSNRKRNAWYSVGDKFDHSEVLSIAPPPSERHLR